MLKCIITGKEHTNLLYFVADSNGKVWFDPLGKAANNGVCVVARQGILTKAITSGALCKALGAKNATGLVAQVETVLKKRFYAALGLARKSGALVLGAENVTDALRQKKVTTIIVASDIGKDTNAKVNNWVKKGAKIYKISTKDTLLSSLGVVNCVAIAILHGESSRGLLQELEIYATFGDKVETK